MMESYSVYGVTFRTSIPFLSPLSPPSGPPLLQVIEQNGAIPLDGTETLATLPEEYRDRAAPQSIHSGGETHILHFPLGDQILVRPDVMVYAHGGQHAVQYDLVDVRILGSGFAWWLLRQGRLPFHAGAMEIDGEAVLFSAESRTGKSSLICSLLLQGIPLLCDDFTTVHLDPSGIPMAAPAYPQMRLWPPSVAQFVGDPADHPPVVAGHPKKRIRVGDGWGRFLEQSLPVSRIYFLERLPSTSGAVSVQRLSGHEAFMTLLAALSMGSLYPTADFQPLLATVQELAWRLPVYRLTYPSGWQWLPSLHEAIFDPSRFLSLPHSGISLRP